MAKTPVVRPYDAKDWAALCRIHDAARLDELRLSVGVGAFLDLEATAEPEGLFEGELWVAMIDNDVVGFVAWTDEELTWLYVDPIHYKKGYGRALLQTAIDRAGPALTTQVLEGNTPALALYSAMGFEIIERKEGKLVGNEAFPAVGFTMRRMRPDTAADAAS